MLQSTEKAEKVYRGGLKGSRSDYSQTQGSKVRLFPDVSVSQYCFLIALDIMLFIIFSLRESTGMVGSTYAVDP
jgi:hypothetical protein